MKKLKLQLQNVDDQIHLLQNKRQVIVKKIQNETCEHRRIKKDGVLFVTIYNKEDGELIVKAMNEMKRRQLKKKQIDDLYDPNDDPMDWRY